MPIMASTTTESVRLQVQGMTCSNCALSIERYLQKQGMDEISISFADDDVRFRMPSDTDLEKLIDGIEHIGYRVLADDVQQQRFWTPIRVKLLISAVLTAPLLLSMFFHGSVLQDPLVQLIICTPVFLIGLEHFGRSAFHSLRSAVPNMDVLIVLGSTAAYIYSVIGYIQNLGHDYLFFETAATIITLVLLGNLIEERAVRQTTSALRSLAALQSGQVRRLIKNGSSLSRADSGLDPANMSKGGGAAAESIPFEQILSGDHILVEEGEKIPLDGVVINGSGQVDESLISGESLPLVKQPGDSVIGGSVLQSGLLFIEVKATGNNTILSGIISLVRNASSGKGSIQRMADRVSAWFVPIVVAIALATFFLSWSLGIVPAPQALLRAIAVLVISCPCAMGLATPTALSVGLGRAARQGILVKGSDTLERVQRIRRVVLDKTGTLSNGKFQLENTQVLDESLEPEELKDVVAALAACSSHPVSKSLSSALGARRSIVLQQIEEVRGMGVSARDEHNVLWQLGSARWRESPSNHHAKDTVLTVATDIRSDVVLFRDGVAVLGMQLRDELREGVPELIAYLQGQNIEPIILSGDREHKVKELADSLGIAQWYAGKLPAEKLEIIRRLNAESPVAMVGDGINDAPALAEAELGISLLDSTRAARQASGVVLLGGRPDQIIQLFALSKHTLLTVKQNLFWAFFYNTLAIPIAAVGLLNPMIAAGAMAFSDLIVIGNSLRLRRKNIGVKA